MRRLERKKLFEAIGFFLRNTKYPGLVKLFKLLYYLDMLHFRETGRSVTGLTYKALPYGPVPTELYDQIRNPPADMGNVISITSPPAPLEVTETKGPITVIKAKSIEEGFLTKRELRIAGEVAEIFHDATADQISEISHPKNGPWDMAKKAGGGKWGHPINFLDSTNLDLGTGKPKSIEILKEEQAEYEEVRKRFA